MLELYSHLHPDVSAVLDGLEISDRQQAARMGYTPTSQAGGRRAMV